jgi:hypothetical protein
MVSRQVRRVTDGGRELRAWLDEKAISVPRFCDQHELERVTVQRALNGELKRVSVDLAFAIKQATRGAVAIEAWLSATARPPRDDEVRRGGRRLAPKPKRTVPTRRSDARSAGRARGRRASALRSATRPTRGRT